MFKSASHLLTDLFRYIQHIHEQPLSQPVPANDIPGSFTPRIGKLDGPSFQPHQAHLRHFLQRFGQIDVATIVFALHVQPLYLRLAVLVGNPHRFQDFINETGFFHDRVGTSSCFFCRQFNNALNRLTILDSVRNS